MYDKITALYCRFSRDDGQEQENASITHQKELLQEYTNNHGFTNCRFYADDGYTGTNFDRPDFQRMLEDAENGLISTIIVKDMSRFGRNYILVGQYVELVLPQYDVRVIGITDNYDSYNTENDMFAFESVFNELYVADISKKVQYAKKMLGMNGVKLTSRPLYGYKIVDGIYDKWAIDESSAKIVRLIYDLFLNEDYSVYAIVKYLRENKIFTSGAYMGYKYTTKHNPYDWNFTMVKRILTFQEYCGDTVNFKTKTVSYKTKTVIHNPKEEWVIFENAHPAIISREDFEKVQEKLKTIHKNAWNSDNSEKYDTFFRRKCICDMCGSSMYRGSVNNKLYYRCGNYVTYRGCSSNYITENYLCQIVADYLKRLYFAVKSDKNIISEKLGLTELQTVETEIISAENRMQKISNLQKNLYEKYFHGDVSAEDFKKLSENYAREKDGLLQIIGKLTTRKSTLKRKSESALKMLKTISELKESDFDELTKETCDLLIEKIVIGRPAGNKQKNYGKRKINIYIYGLGNISDFVDVRYRTFTERIGEIAPQLILERRCFKTVFQEILGVERGTLYDALREENITFQTIIMTVKKEIIIDAIKRDLPIQEIYRLTGYSERNSLHCFIRRSFGMNYAELCKKIKSESNK